MHTENLPSDTSGGGRLRRGLLLVLGTVALALGIIGIFLPLLPTTPWLLAAAWCYARSSQRFYNWLLHNRWFGSYIRNYREGRGILLRHKIVALTTLWLTIGSTMLFFTDKLWLRLLLFIIATLVTRHIAKLKRYRP